MGSSSRWRRIREIHPSVTVPNPDWRSPIQSALIRYWSRRRNCWIVFLLDRVVKCFTTGVKRPAALYDGRGELLKLPATPRCVRELMDALLRSDRLRPALSFDIIVISTLQSCCCKNFIFEECPKCLRFALSRRVERLIIKLFCFRNCSQVR